MSSNLVKARHQKALKAAAAKRAGKKKAHIAALLPLRKKADEEPVFQLTYIMQKKYPSYEKLLPFGLDSGAAVSTFDFDSPTNFEAPAPVFTGTIEIRKPPKPKT